MYPVLMVLQVLIALALIGLILLQHGKGADAGAAFGAGASGTVFGARGSANFLSRATAWLAAAFFVVSLALAYLVSGEMRKSDSVVDRVATQPAASEQADDASLVPDPDTAGESQQPSPAQPPMPE